MWQIHFPVVQISSPFKYIYHIPSTKCIIAVAPQIKHGSQTLDFLFMSDIFIKEEIQCIFQYGHLAPDVLELGLFPIIASYSICIYPLKQMWFHKPVIYLLTITIKMTKKKWQNHNCIKQAYYFLSGKVSSRISKLQNFFNLSDLFPLKQNDSMH